jgi:hypothetical protein
MLATIQSITFSLLVCCLKNIKIRIHKTIILPVVLYGCETFSLTLREEQRLRVFENRVLRIFGPLNKLRDDPVHICTDCGITLYRFI